MSDTELGEREVTDSSITTTQPTVLLRVSVRYLVRRNKHRFNSIKQLGCRVVSKISPTKANSLLIITMTSRRSVPGLTRTTIHTHTCGQFIITT